MMEFDRQQELLCMYYVPLSIKIELISVYSPYCAMAMVGLIQLLNAKMSFNQPLKRFCFLSFHFTPN